MRISWLAPVAVATGISFAPAIDSSAAENTKRPYRMAVLKMSPKMDNAKPLASQDGAGWVMNSGILIGGHSEDWVGGTSIFNTAGTSLTIQKKQVWWLKGPAPMTAPPGSFGTSVVLGFRDGTVKKVEALTGKVQWSSTLDAFVEREFLLASSSTLIVVTAAQTVYALDYQSGKTLWLFDGGFPDGLTIRGGVKPIVYDGKIIFGVASGEILAIDAQSGKPVWRYNPLYSTARFHDVVGELVVRNNRLLVSRYDGFVGAIDIGSSDRNVVWQDRLPGLATSAFRNGRFYVGGVNGDLYAYDVDDGRKVWRVKLGSSISTITAGESTLFVSGSDGRITSVSSSDGSILWHDDLGGDVSSRPILAEDAIYFSTGLKNIYAYRLK